MSAISRPVPTEPRHFIVTDQLLHDPQPIDGFTTVPAANEWARTHDVGTDYRVVHLPGPAGYIAALIRENDEDAARTHYGDAACDTYFDEVEGLDVFAMRVDVDELTRRLEAIGDEVTALADSIGLPDPGAATTEDLVREMWAKVHAHGARQNAEHGLAVNETRMLGLSS